MRTPALLLLAIAVTATITWGFTQPPEEQQIMVVRYAEVFGGGRKSITVVKPDGTLEMVDLEQGKSDENMGVRLAKLQQTLAKYQKDGWRLTTSVSNAWGGQGWFQDHFLVK